MAPRTPDASVKRQAIAAANARKAPAEPLAWSEALAEAPLPAFSAPAWESLFRSEYAARLVKRGHAKKAIAKGKPGKPGTRSELNRMVVYLSQEEADQQKAQAQAVGLSWSTWARRKLAL